MKKTLFCGKLPYAVTSDDLRLAVEQYTEVHEAFVVLDKETKKSRGFGFVTVPDEKAALVIESLNGAEWGGMTMVVKEAEPRPERPNLPSSPNRHRGPKQPDR